MKKLKSLLVYTFVLVLAMALVGCSSKEDVSKLQQIKDKGVLVVGTSADYPPYEFHKEIDGKDTIVGFDMAIAQEIANDLGVKLEIKDMKFDGLLGALTSGNIDMVAAGMTPTEDRQKNADFSKIYYTGQNVIIVNKANVDKYKTIEDLKDLKIGAQKSSIQEQFAKDEIKATNIKSLSKIQDLVLELNNGNVDAVVLSSNTADSYLKNYDKLTLANIELASGDEGSAMAFKKSEDKELINEVNKTLDKLMKEGKVEQFVDEATKLSQ
jgi:arginine/lysine/histidine transporter system substrate-binding protein